MSVRLLLQYSCHSCSATGKCTATLFPYTTLFRSKSWGDARLCGQFPLPSVWLPGPDRRFPSGPPGCGANLRRSLVDLRPEEPTSELQSRRELVFRLKLEK